MVRAGELREVITIEVPQRVSIGGGASSTTYTAIKTTFAKVREERSNPVLTGNQENITNDVRFTIRYLHDIVIGLAYRVEWRGYKYIVNNIKVDHLQTTIEMVGKMIIETSERKDF